MSNLLAGLKTPWEPDPRWPPEQAGTTSAIVSAGTSIAIDVVLPPNQAAHLAAQVRMSHVDGNGVLDAVAHLDARAIVQNLGGVASFASVIAGSSNPDNSGGPAFGTPQVCDALLRVGGVIGGAPSTAIWTIVGTSARLTITNAGAVDATVGVDLSTRYF